MALYKYRSLSNPERFIKILLDKKLYGSFFDELNDPMEGYFRYSKDIDEDVKNKLMEIRKSTCICSLSRRNDIGIMWAHYADEHKGCCIELDVTAQSWKRVDITYDNSILQTGNKPLSPEQLFERKTKQWINEEETRYIKKSQLDKNNKTYKRHHLTISIKRIYMGFKMNNTDFNYWSKLIERINPDIIVERMPKRLIDFGYDK